MIADVLLEVLLEVGVVEVVVWYVSDVDLGP
jgi:hypothetical protein